jgi:hypothetical protein
VFQGSDNHHLYNTRVKDLVKDAVEGMDATVLAYGQTSSGKTFTMMGFEEQPGIIPQAVNGVFASIRDLSHNREFLLRVSYLVFSIITFRKFIMKRLEICLTLNRKI